MDEDDALHEVERWFRSRGIPHFIGGYSASRDVFTRALPALTLVLILELLGALNLTWPWWANLGVAAASIAAVVVVWAVANAARGRRALARFDSSADVAALVDGTPAAALCPPSDAAPSGTPRLGRR